MTRPRQAAGAVVSLGGAVPYAGVRHAGGLYIERLTQELLQNRDVRIIAPDHDANLAAANLTDRRLDVMLIGRWVPGQGPAKRLYLRGIGLVDRALRRIDPALPPLTFLNALYFDGEVRSAIRSADRVDLQWFEFIRLAPHVRRLNRSALISGTYHDVLSQLFERNAERAPAEHARWTRAAKLARRAERRSIRHLDRILTLNDKDASLLRDAGAREVTVVNPPLAPTTVRGRPPAPTGVPNVVFLAYFGRAFNVEAAEWFVKEIWPTVRAAVPTATFELIGSDPDERLDGLISPVDGVSASGFVADLEEAYARAAVAVVPLLTGSGVKFKTIEAITHAVPAVATSVGAEGVIAVEQIEAVVDDAAGFADAVIGALRNLDAAESRASDLAARVRTDFGTEQFAKTMSEVYGLPETTIDTNRVTVVIPYYGDPADTLALIERIRDQEGIHEIVVADDASPIPFPDVPGVRVVRRSLNGGFGSAVNAGAAEVATDLMLVLNSDLEIGDTFVPDMLAAAAPLQPGVFSPQVLKASGAPEWTARRFPSVRHHVVEWLSPLARWRHLPVMHRAVGHVTDLTPGGVDRTDWVIGAAMLIPVHGFRSVGGFDERFHMTSEEVDLQLRLRQTGVPSYVVDSVEVTHLGGGSSDSARRRQWLVTARQRYAVKWGGDRVLSATLAVASLLNFAVNGTRQLSGRDVDARATLRYELGLLRTARQQSRPAATPGDPSPR